MNQCKFKHDIKPMKEITVHFLQIVHLDKRKKVDEEFKDRNDITNHHNNGHFHF